MNLSRTIRLAGAAGLAVGATLGATTTAANAAHVDETIVVTDYGTTGDLTIPDDGPLYTTPTTFTTDEASTGAGSLFVEPIENTTRIETVNGQDKTFVGAEKFIGYVKYDIPADEFESLSFDFQLGEGSDAGDVQDFYLNVYAITEPGETFYNCRYDQVAVTGSEDGFTTLSVDATEPTTRVASRDATCPATIAGLPEGSTINYAAINVGQSTASDEGTSGYIDNVIVDNAGDATAYDLEKAPESKQECQDGNTAGFKNQGECVSSFAKAGSNGKKG